MEYRRHIRVGTSALREACLSHGAAGAARCGAWRSLLSVGVGPEGFWAGGGLSGIVMLPYEAASSLGIEAAPGSRSRSGEQARGVASAATGAGRLNTSRKYASGSRSCRLHDRRPARCETALYSACASEPTKVQFVSAHGDGAKLALRAIIGGLHAARRRRNRPSASLCRSR
jgi:hypothetical protein